METPVRKNNSPELNAAIAANATSAAEYVRLWFIMSICVLGFDNFADVSSREFNVG